MSAIVAVFSINSTNAVTMIMLKPPLLPSFVTVL